MANKITIPDFGDEKPSITIPDFGDEPAAPAPQAAAPQRPDTEPQQLIAQAEKQGIGLTPGQLFQLPIDPKAKKLLKESEPYKEVARMVVHGTGIAGQFFLNLPDTFGTLFFGSDKPNEGNLYGAWRALTEEGYVTALANQLTDSPKSIGGSAGADAIATALTGRPAGAAFAVVGKGVKAGVRATARVTGIAKRVADNRLKDIEQISTHLMATGSPRAESINIAAQSIAGGTEGLGELMRTARRAPNFAQDAAEAGRRMKLAGTFERSGTVDTIDRVFGIMGDRIRRIDPKLWSKLSKMELRQNLLNNEIFEGGQRLLKRIPWFKGTEVKRALINRDWSTLKALVGTEAVAQWNRTARMMYTVQKEAGLEVEGQLKNYFPRIVKDFEGLKRALAAKKGKEWEGMASRIDENIAKLEKDLDRTLTEIERSDIATRYILGERNIVSLAPRTTKVRKIKTVSDDLLKYYADPHEALARTAQGVSKAVAKREFLGYSKVYKPGLKTLDIDKSIGASLANSEIYRHNAVLEREMAGYLRTLLHTADEPVHPFWQGVRNLTYMTTIANFRSALTQLGDVGIAVARYGLSNTLYGILNHKIVPVNLGINIAAQELNSSTRILTRTLERSLKIGGFQMMDMFGKRVQMNAALRSIERQARIGDHRAFWKAWGGVYGEELGTKILADAKAGRLSQELKLHIFNTLTETQPLTFLQTPAAFANNPNGRVFYTLSTFAIRQMNMVINAARAQPNKILAAKELTRYAVIMGLSGMGVQEIKKMLFGRTVSAEDIAPDFGFNMTGIFLVSQWFVKDAKRDGLFHALIGAMTPFEAGAKLLDNTIRGGLELALEGDPTKLKKAIANAGPLAPLYWWFLDEGPSGGGGRDVRGRESER